MTPSVPAWDAPAWDAYDRPAHVPPPLPAVTRCGKFYRWTCTRPGCDRFSAAIYATPEAARLIGARHAEACWGLS